MNIIFLTLVEIESVEQRGIYQDLLRKFRDEGHEVTIVTPVQRRREIDTNLCVRDGVSILQVKTLNIQKTNIIEKGIGTIAIEYQYLSAIKNHLPDLTFDIVLYSTPPITLVKVVEYIKKRDGAYSYLLLKDIFPQNAVDMGMMKKDRLIHSRFRLKEKKLYEISDAIGCMSPANVNFLLTHNPELEAGKVEVNPNSVEPVYHILSSREKTRIRKKYGLPQNRKILVYGGNLGIPQGLDFLLETITSVQNPEAFFLIVGDGTEYERIAGWFADHLPPNAKLLGKLPKAEYDALLASCDIGLIFLDKNFLIPNFPSRLLSYLEMGKPVITATDPHTDIGDIVQHYECGYKVHAGDLSAMMVALDQLISEDLTVYPARCRVLLEKEYHVDHSYAKIMDRVRNLKNGWFSRFTDFTAVFLGASIVRTYWFLLPGY
ncbi:MAG: glycosyltransferase family 4 protein [Weeksellaceae bacterium]|nr:glycosyltransferase family 4 protein [Bacteroidota bacterium]MCG2781597.1 glycosyltransferase family 4 protein [Weeksellaceae bacterium]